MARLPWLRQLGIADVAARSRIMSSINRGFPIWIVPEPRPAWSDHCIALN
jgi:hypothetical protein